MAKKKKRAEMHEDCYEITSKYIKTIQGVAADSPNHSHSILFALKAFLEKHLQETNDQLEKS